MLTLLVCTLRRQHHEALTPDIMVATGIGVRVAFYLNALFTGKLSGHIKM